MTDRDDTKRTLEAWAARLVDELGITGAIVDIDEILKLAGVAAHSVIRPAAPVTTYLVGYAAGLAAANASGGPAAASADAGSPAPRTDAAARAEALAHDFADRKP